MKKYIYIIIAVLFVLLAVGVGIGISRAHVELCDDHYPSTRIYIPSSSSYAALCDTLESYDGNWSLNRPLFHLLARVRKLPNHVKSGSYIIEDGMSIFTLVSKLNSGNQDAIRITINKHRTKQSLCRFLGKKMEFSSDSLLALLTDTACCSQFGETPQTILGLFPRNTYEVYWTTSPLNLLKRMQRESDAFWQKRKNQLSQLGMTRQQVITLASIVEEETNADDEKADIASVYLNRLRLGMPLQADPTVKYAIGDFTIQRILNRMLAYESPYNTYLHTGLPPGPICIPSTTSIDAVLKNKKTPWIYFCAKEDFSGRHNFSSNLTDHQQNANRFHKALNNKKIYS